jgi:hypothetical protein
MKPIKLKKYKNAVKWCRVYTLLFNKAYRVIKEGDWFLIVTDEDYKLAYREFCGNIKQFESGECCMLLVHSTYTTKKLSFDEAVEKAEQRAKETGMVFHVVKLKGRYFEVHEKWFSVHKGISLYKAEPSAQIKIRYG